MEKQITMTRKITALLLAIMLVLSFALQPLKTKVYAADDKKEIETELDDVSEIFALDKKAPKDLNSLPDSAYNNVADKPFLLSEENELFFLSSTGKTKSANIFDTVDLSDYTSKGDKVNGPVLTRSINRASAKRTSNVYSGISLLDDMAYTEGVAFDPTGSGRKDHVAISGLIFEKKGKEYHCFTKVVVLNLKNGGSASMVFSESMDWLADKKMYITGNYFSITAGDYDHDGKDTVMLYFTGDESFKIFELAYNNNKISKSDVVNVDSILSKHRTDYRGKKAPEYKKPVVNLTTGDLDGDGKDELAYMAGYLKTSDTKNGFKGDINYLEPYCAYISIVENENGKFTASAPAYMYTKGSGTGEKNWFYYQVMHAGSVTAGDIDGDGTDELVAVAYTSKPQVKVVDKKIKSVKEIEKLDTENYAYAMVKHTGKGYSFTDVETVNMSEFIKKHFSNSDSVFAPITLASAKVNGANNPEFIFIDGVIYTFDMGSPTPVFEGDMKRGLGSILGGLSGGSQTDSSVNWIQNVTVGNFDGNAAGREQFAFVALEKHYGKERYSANLGVIAGIDYSDVLNDKKEVISYGTTQSFASSFYIEDAYYHNRNVNGNDKNATQIFVDAYSSASEAQLTFLPIAIDNDDDGLLARQGKKGYAYTDPSLVAVLQAGPYYKELDDAGVYADSCETVYSIETSTEYAKSTGDNVSFGVGFAGELQVANFKASLEVGYSLDWTHTFENATETTYSSEFAVGQEDAVVISRIPEVVYCYDVYKNGRWVKNGYTMRVAKSPVYFLLTTDDYNDFAAQYNAKVNKEVFLPITDDDMPADHKGNPFAYYKDVDKGTVGYTMLSNSDYGCTPGTGSITSAYTTSASKSESREMSHGFNFSLTLQGGGEFGSSNEAWAGGYVNLDYSHSSGSSKTTTKANSASGTVLNPEKNLMSAAGMDNKLIGSYHFKWDLIKWTRPLQEGVDVPFYGYAVNDVNAPAIPVSDFAGEFKNNGKGKMEIVLTWSDPGDMYRPTEKYVIYSYDEKGNKKELATLNADKTSYTFETEKGKEEYEFTIASKSKTSSRFSSESEPVVLTAKNKNIYNIELTKTEDLVDTYTIFYTDGSTSEFTVKNGEKGEKGDKGDPGAPGASGGGTFTITASPLIDPATGNVFGVIVNYPDGSKLYDTSDGAVFVYPNGQRVGSETTWNGIQDILNPNTP